jgi:hypothetical protein
MHQLWLKFSNHPNLKHIINDFNDQDLSVRYEMESFKPGTVDWCLCDMRRHLIFQQCKKECLEHIHIAPTHSDRCKICDTVYFIDHTTSTKVCTGCGISIDILTDDVYDYSTQSRYNGQRHHHYDPSEHFSQTICDFTCTGSRRIPVEVFAFCRSLLGRGTHVSSHNVFLALQMGGYRAYYMYKYEITNRLRGEPEFTLSSHEIQSLRDNYKRYRYEFIPFQQTHNIGSVSKRGKPRIYWPVRFILKKMCQEIGRDDLCKYIRTVCDKKKLKLYNVYWDKLKTFIDSTRPKRDTRNHALDAIPLRPRCHIKMA